MIVFSTRIFQRFAQADSSDSRSKAGTGLGLSIAKSLIEGMKGEIGFAAAEGGGTCFFIGLPWLPTVDQPKDPGAVMMLVCEPDLDVARSFRRILEQGGGTVHVAPTKERARELLGRFAYGIVVLDLLLADGSASSLIGEIRANPATRAVPVVVVSRIAAVREPDTAALLVVDILPRRMDVARLVEATRTACALTRSERCTGVHIESDGERRQLVQRALAEICQLRSTEDVAQALAMLTAS